MKEKFVISIGFHQYIKDKSGTAKVILAHQMMFNKEDISYVHLFAVKKMVLHDKVTLFSYFGMYIDGKFEGIFTPKDVLEKANTWFNEGKILLNIHIHHLLYLKLGNVAEVLDGLPDARIKIFVHDYYLACTNYNLMKNGEVYCGGNGLNDNTCRECTAYKDSFKTEQLIHKLIKKNIERVWFISPSNATKDIFVRFHPEYENRISVVPHQELDGHYTDNLEIVDGRLKLGFMAMPMKHKGWQTWKEIVSIYPNDYEYIVFNSSEDQYEGAEKVKIEFSKDNLNAMTDALRRKKIHAVLLWSMCAETYSYTCFEAYSANAFIITNSISGNIADTVKRKNIGKVFDSEKELLAYMKNPENLRTDVNRFRMNNLGGPLNLIENTEIVRLTISDTATNRSHPSSHTNSIIDQILIKVLNFLFRKEFA